MSARPDDRRAALLLCAPAGVIDDTPPLSASAFNRLLVQVARSPEPLSLGTLLGLAARDLAELIHDPAEAERAARLLARDAQLAFALERLDAEGAWVVTCADAGYPVRLRARLGDRRPPLVFGVGDPSLLERPAIGVVGSRDVDELGSAFAERVARNAVHEGAVVISGGARGTDQVAMDAALRAGGASIGVLADGLLRASRARDARAQLVAGALLLVTPFAPAVGFQAWAAMERNRIVYALAAATVVVATVEGSGGTWAGAVEALERAYGAVWVREDDAAPAGNRALAARGARPLIPAELETTALRSLLAAETTPPTDSLQAALF